MSNDVYDDWMQRVLGVTISREAPASGVGDPMDDFGIDLQDYAKAVLAQFQQAGESVDAQVSALQAALREVDDPDLHEIADSGLNGLTNRTRVPLQAALLEAGKGAEALKKVAPKLLAAAEQFRVQLEADARIAACDDNPFGVACEIQDTYAAALDAVSELAESALRH